MSLALSLQVRPAVITSLRLRMGKALARAPVSQRLGLRLLRQLPWSWLAASGAGCLSGGHISLSRARAQAVPADEMRWASCPDLEPLCAEETHAASADIERLRAAGFLTPECEYLFR